MTQEKKIANLLLNNINARINKIIEDKKTKKELDYINGQLKAAIEENRQLKDQLMSLQSNIEDNDNL